MYKKLILKILCIHLMILSHNTHLKSQPFLTPSDTFQPVRFVMVASTGAVIYGGTVIGLNEAWYKGFDRTSFHFFNDRGEWNNMDKMGHLFTSYFETELSYRGSRWTGIRENQAIWLATGLGILFQGTIEMFDAYSARWGFSVNDMIYNLGGTGLFALQQWSWQDQRLRMKVSSWPKKYSSERIQALNSPSQSSLNRRTDDLFGTHFLERYLKDYNAQTIWLSINASSFFPELKIPSWFNLAIGYGSENLYGGFSNNWSEGEAVFSVLHKEYPRTRQWYLSPDIDLRKIKTKNPLLKTVFSVLNIFKIPAPALEYNTTGRWRWHWLFL
ncbi:MAG: DUF2279 domain-containing protein [Saprospiraceae bacterium]|nr:DUF2279 domain-containing protein [Saprospiraceae bacterium]